MNRHFIERIGRAAAAIEDEMRRIGYWSSAAAAPKIDREQLYGGVPFEYWLQFDYLPAIRQELTAGVFEVSKRYRVGIAAMRQYDYHSYLPEAQGLMRACFALESELEAAGLLVNRDSWV